MTERPVSYHWLIDQYVTKKRTGIAIAEEIGITYGALYKQFRKMGIVFPRGRRPNARMEARVLRMRWLELKTPAQIAKEVGVSPASVRQYLAKDRRVR